MRSEGEGAACGARIPPPFPSLPSRSLGDQQSEQQRGAEQHLAAGSVVVVPQLQASVVTGEIE